MYQPAPLDTSSISLPQELSELIEILAENTHENWAAKRVGEGWVYGFERNDVLKTHPCLVPYQELPESEKEYDRITCLETIKVIILSDYMIKRQM